MALDYAALQSGHVSMFDGRVSGERIEGIGTVHVYGREDERALGQGELLWGLCGGEEGRGKGRCVHAKGHAVPGKGRDVQETVGEIRTVMETVGAGGVW